MITINNKKLFNFFDPYRKLHKSIYILFLTQIINSAGSFVFPFLTIYLTKTLSVSVGKAGYFVMLSTGVNIIGTLIGGKLTDYLGRKKVLIIFSCLTAICFIPCAFLTHSLLPWFIIAAAFFNGAIHPAINAMVSDLTNSDNRNFAFSLLGLHE